MFARPAAEGFAAFAATVDGVGEANLQDGFLRLLRRFLDAQWERVEIQYRISLVHQTTGRNVSVAKNHVTARVPGGVIPTEADEMEPVSVPVVIPIHDFHLAEVDAFAANIDIRRRLIE